MATASAGELQGALCTQLDATSTDELVADTRTALAQVPDSQLQALSDAERARLDENLPGIIARIETEYCAGAGEAPRGPTPSPPRARLAVENHNTPAATAAAPKSGAEPDKGATR